MTTNRRLRVVMVHPQGLAMTLQRMAAGEPLRINGLPDDVQIVSVTERWDKWPFGFAVLVQSDTFDEVPDGEPVPELIPMIESLRPRMGGTTDGA
jgi:hypothetical protein